MRRCGALLTDFLPQGRKACVQLRTRGVARLLARAHHQIQRGKLALMHAKRLADDAADAGAADPPPRRPHRPRQSQSRSARFIVCGNHREESVTNTPAARVGGVEIPLAPEAKPRRQCEPPWHRALAKDLSGWEALSTVTAPRALGIG